MPGDFPATPLPEGSSANSGEKKDLRPDDLYDVDVSDPLGQLVDRTGMSPDDVSQITRLMQALVALRAAEQHLADASQKYMRLNETDMRALHYLIGCLHQGRVATPGAIAHHLGISTASTTKLLDRLERGSHIVRGPHPTDRRALAISITPQTHRAAMATVGRQQAKRFHAAARLDRDEREVVIRFLQDMTQEISLTDESWAHENGHEEN